MLDVEGGAVIGTSYAGGNPAPDNGLIVQGDVGIGTATPGAKMHVVGDMIVTGDLMMSPGSQIIFPSVEGPDNDLDGYVDNNSFTSFSAVYNASGYIQTGGSMYGTDCDDSLDNITEASDLTCDEDHDGWIDETAFVDLVIPTGDPSPGDCDDDYSIVNPGVTDYTYGSFNNGDYNCNNEVEKVYRTSNFLPADDLTFVPVCDNFNPPGTASCSDFFETLGPLPDCGSYNSILAYRCKIWHNSNNCMNEDEPIDIYAWCK